jgi:hypothetical protein
MDDHEPTGRWRRSILQQPGPNQKENRPAGVFDTGTVAWIPDLSGSGVVQQITLNLLTVFGQGPVGHTHPS